MSRYLIAATKSWNAENFRRLETEYRTHDFLLVTSKDELNVSVLESFRPEYIFFPHWSWIIPHEIYDRYNCVVFHMTDLPFGRGGSPLQNLIARGIYKTKISAIKVCAGIDTGPVYFKEDFDISKGSAEEILKHASDVVFDRMIPRFFAGNLIPHEQTGEIVTFQRRKPEQSEIPGGLSMRQIYDYIRMLDGEGYPAAFRRYDGGKIYFTDATYRDGTLTAKVKFTEDMTE